VVFREVEDRFDVLFRFVVCEESRMWRMPVTDDFFSLPIRTLAPIQLSMPTLPRLSKDGVDEPSDQKPGPCSPNPSLYK
jgi:hypothetical protein